MPESAEWIREVPVLVEARYVCCLLPEVSFPRRQPANDSGAMTTAETEHRGRLLCMTLGFLSLAAPASRTAALAALTERRISPWPKHVHWMLR